MTSTGSASLFNWNSFLRQYSRDLLERLEDRDFTSVPSQMIKAHWLGYPGATEEDISATEVRLGINLPPSYRNFLTVSNGWWMFNDLLGRLYQIQEIERFATRRQDVIDAWNQGIEADGGFYEISDEDYFVYGERQDTASFRIEYLPTTLEIGGDENKGFILLNPQIVFENGEWEAWEFAAWFPGARRYRSFLDMMQQAHSAILDLPKLRDIPQ